MSRYVAALVYRKRVGSMARKSILAYCAERANDDGSGVWASKITISKEVECSKQTVISTMASFVKEGLMIEAGKRKCANGYVVEYDLNIAQIEALPDAISQEESTGPILDRSNELTPRGQTVGPQEVKPVDPNRPLTVLKPSNNGSDEPALFSAMEEPESQEDPVESGFDTFWKEIWPSHFRKAGKVDCRKLYRKACEGKHPKADERLTPEQLNAAARRYIASVDDRQYLKAPKAWLNGALWEPWMDAPDSERARRNENWMERVQ